MENGQTNFNNKERAQQMPKYRPICLVNIMGKLVNFRQAFFSASAETEIYSNNLKLNLSPVRIQVAAKVASRPIEPTTGKESMVLHRLGRLVMVVRVKFNVMAI